MHTFGHPCRIDKIVKICKEYYIDVIEDAAESLGSKFKGQHTGTFGKMGILSFNGNKIITSGGGGAILTNNKLLAKKAKHITTTAKLAHKWEYSHDMVAYNYRMPNINAALLVAQLENINLFLSNKRKLASDYEFFFKKTGLNFFKELPESKSNYWLNSIILNHRKERNLFLENTNSNGIMTRPIWKLMNKLKMYKNIHYSNLDNSQFLENRVINIPSSVREKI